MLDIPIYITGMSFGALSYEAKIALARGATMAGTATCSGEGGMIPDERRYSSKWFYQCIQSRYGFNPHHLRLADCCEFFIGQGCKVGLGGHLMGQKVTDQVAEMRSLPAGIDQRSPARHSGLARARRSGAEDPGDPRGDQLGDSDPAEARRRARLRRRAHGGQVRAGQHLHRRHGRLDRAPARISRPRRPACPASPPSGRRARRWTIVGKTGEISLVYAGGISNGGDVAKALALGADAVAIGHAALMALNCNKDIPEADYENEIGVEAGYCYHCHTGRCPVGVATQDPVLRKRLDPDEAAERVFNFLHTLTIECQMMARACGKTNVHSLEPEDLAALTMEASALAMVPLAGTQHTVGRPDMTRYCRRVTPWHIHRPRTQDVDKFIKDAAGLDSKREKEIGQHIGYRYDVNLVPDYSRVTPFLTKYMETMGWNDLNWLEDVHMGYEEGRPAVFDRNVNGWVTVPPT